MSDPWSFRVSIGDSQTPIAQMTRTLNPQEFCICSLR